MSMDFTKLSAPFPPDAVQWRVGSTTQQKDRGIALAYIDARDVMDRLDSVCGYDGWQCRYPHANSGKTVCEIGIKVSEEEWIWKADGAGDTQFEADKGALSDAFKRAAVRWGIGRYLYDLPAPWVGIQQRGRSYAIQESEFPRLRKMLEAVTEAAPQEPLETRSAPAIVTDDDDAPKRPRHELTIVKGDRQTNYYARQDKLDKVMMEAQRKMRGARNRNELHATYKHYGVKIAEMPPEWQDEIWYEYDELLEKFEEPNPISAG